MSSITVPASGSVISSGDLEATYDTIRNKANTLTSADFARQALGVQHFAKNTGGVIRVRDFVENTVATAVTGTMTDETSADIIANWTQLTQYRLDGTGAGYSATGSSWLIWYMTLRLSEWSSIPDNEHMGFFAATYAIDGGAETLAPLMPVGVHGTGWTGRGTLDPKRTDATWEEPVAWWGAIDLTAKTGSWTLNYIKFYAARCACNVAGLPTNFTVKHGTTGFFLVKA
jgi:hypothetical protein|tara:strand:- start:19819 stop:20505 length:687 start_codon:yes stop_codon:yes gene_type:complete